MKKIHIMITSAMMFETCVKVVLVLLVNTNILLAAYTGGQPAEFLQFGASARAMAMKAFFSIADDATALYYNPAGLPQCSRKEISALHTELFPNTQTIYDYLGFVYPTIKYGVFSIAVNQLLSTGFEKIKIEFDPQTYDIVKIENLGTFDDRQIALILGYGKDVAKQINIGLAAKYVSRKLDVYSDMMLGIDANCLITGFNSYLPLLNVAVGVKNLISMSYNTEDKLPIIFKLGASYRFFKRLLAVRTAYEKEEYFYRLTVGIDFEKNVNAELKWMLGAEYWLFDFLALRLGFEGLSYLKEVTAGLGGRYKDYGIDYSFAYHDLGFSHRVSASMKWGKSVKFDKDEVIKRLISEAIARYTAGQFLEATKTLQSAYQVDPNRKDVKKMLDNLLLITAYITSATEDTEEHQGIRKAVQALMEDDIMTTVNALRYAYYKNPANKPLHQLLNRMEQLAGLPLTEAYKEEIAGWTIIDKKIYEAREDVLNGRYTDAIRKCQEVLNLEPKNTTALEIMGSAFFMMNEVDKAKAVWKKVLELDPTNRVVQQFLQELE
ncbi:MAG: PorV/PorQ family protein [Endomicrobia bacterium]|nr:PorV/PorQ family protein [Endomicrobiia bacterium]